jgi:hypothetical protein
VSHWYPPGNLDCELVASSGYQTLLLHTIEDTTYKVGQNRWLLPRPFYHRLRIDVGCTCCLAQRTRSWVKIGKLTERWTDFALKDGTLH